MALKSPDLKKKTQQDSRNLTRAQKGKTRTYSVTVPVQIMEELRDYAISRGLSLAAGVRLAVTDFLERQGRM